MPLETLTDVAKPTLTNSQINAVQGLSRASRKRRRGPETRFCQGCNQQCDVDSFMLSRHNGRSTTPYCDCHITILVPAIAANITNKGTTIPAANNKNAAPNQPIVLANQLPCIPAGFISQYKWRRQLFFGFAPRFGTCCRKGKVLLPAIRPPPDDLKELYTSTTGPAIAFQDNICYYNSALAFTSINYQADNHITGGIRPF
ncbi:hypothetical protein TSTA_077210 [Talaromyces stipitatus ATCC 10500]|uniref:Uncharacterized protein n=1 Tax=Talaromyces stipitatus (strain ATCC 10500 / CBS 375.48 / QM 6759 / NRRL 1006) TaxID=441959 RepID=B8LVY8_TALSN|nr:uncharacterized protein TSTA_077210 [Talaromyces stipitatus ATCC 10500]EED24354.1 hypothetical protein TSTA_077210 [Talaromyces stipitatus ATCC 10500]